MLDRDKLSDLVQDALSHLFDSSYLGGHPLGGLLCPAVPAESRGRALYRLLQGAIDALEPPREAPRHSPVWRSYHCLCLRYREMLTMPRVAEELGISGRQCRRAHHDAVESIVGTLWDRYVSLGRSPTTTTSAGVEGGASLDPSREGPSALESEVDRLRRDSDNRGTDLAAAIESATATIEPLARVRSVQLAVEHALVPSSVAIGRESLRQALLAALHYVINWASAGCVRVRAETVGDRAVVVLAAEKPEPNRLEAVGESLSSKDLAVARLLVEGSGGRISEMSTDIHLSISLELPALCSTATVLVVDDNPDLIDLCRRYLAGEGYHVIAASNGEQAIKEAQDARPDVVVLDVMMPSRDSWEVLQNLLNHPTTRGTPVIICSVLPDRDLSLALGAADFLPKPLSRQQLLRALEGCMATRGRRPETA